MSALKDNEPGDSFDVNDAIRREVKKAFLASSGEAIDVASIAADKLIRSVPADAKIAYFDQWIRDRVRHVIKDDRKPVELAADATSIKKAGEPNQRWTANVLNKGFSVGDNLTKRLGDFTVEDCDLVAESYATLKRQNAAWEKRFRRLRDVMTDAGVARASDLGADVLRGLGF